MPTKITINKEWLDKLIRLVDELSQVELNDDCPACRDKHGWLSHLLGYVHSLDEYLKD
jgi:hypothetical protein